MKNKTLLAAAAAAVLMAAPAAFAEDMPMHGKEGPHGGWHKGAKFEAMDTDGDGAVSKDEFMAEHMKRFEKIDANADGSVSKEEIEAYRAAKRAKMHEMKEKMDEDGGEEAGHESEE